MAITDFEVGELVFDDLTAHLHTIIKITGENNILDYWLDSKYLGGGRHPWEIIKIQRRLR